MNTIFDHYNSCAFCKSPLDKSSHFTDCRLKANFFKKVKVCHHCINTESEVEAFFDYPAPYTYFVDMLFNGVNSHLLSANYSINKDRVAERFSIDMEKQKRVLIHFLKEDERHAIEYFLKNLNEVVSKKYNFSVKKNPYKHFNQDFIAFELILTGIL